MSEIPHPHAAHDSDCGRFACQFLVQSFFWGKCRFNLLYNIGGGLKKCYTVLRRVGGWSRIRFLHYIICGSLGNRAVKHVCVYVCVLSWTMVTSKQPR